MRFQSFLLPALAGSSALASAAAFRAGEENSSLSLPDKSARSPSGALPSSPGERNKPRQVACTDATNVTHFLIHQINTPQTQWANTLPEGPGTGFGESEGELLNADAGCTTATNEHGEQCGANFDGGFKFQCENQLANFDISALEENMQFAFQNFSNGNQVADIPFGFGASSQACQQISDNEISPITYSCTYNLATNPTAVPNSPAPVSVVVPSASTTSQSASNATPSASTPTVPQTGNAATRNRLQEGSLGAVAVALGVAAALA